MLFEVSSIANANVTSFLPEYITVKLKEDFNKFKKEFDERKEYLKSLVETKDYLGKLNEIVSFVERKDVEFKEKASDIINVKVTQSKKSKKLPKDTDQDIKQIIEKFFEEKKVDLYKQLMKHTMSSIEKVKEENEILTEMKVQLVLTLRKFLRLNKSSIEENRSKLSRYINKLGFYDLASAHKINDGKVDESKRASFARFQLENMGQHLEHETPAEKDPRISAFNPVLTFYLKHLS